MFSGISTDCQLSRRSGSCSHFTEIERLRVSTLSAELLLLISFDDTNSPVLKFGGRAVRSFYV